MSEQNVAKTESIQRDPFNISLIAADKSRLAGLLPVQSMDIYDSEGNYHPQGLYSTEIFGKPGEKTRMTRHGFIDMKAEVMHPKIFLELSRLKNLYAGIMQGTAYATWDEELKDFVRSDILDGQTGYSFFMKKFPEINLQLNESNIREQRILLINKYRSSCMYRYLIVMPAGLRDIEVDADGRVLEEEINTLYKRAMRISNTIAVSSNSNNPLLDNSRWSLQKTFNEIYDYIQTILEGKRGFILSKWGTRVIHGGTRNVITGMDPAPARLGAIESIGINDTMIGLHQYLKGTVDISIYGIRNSIAGRFINDLPGNVTLIDPKTLEPVSVAPDAKIKEKWGTTDGLESLINGFEYSEVRHNPVLINGHYAALIYMDDVYFKIFHDIKELPLELKRENVRPITWAELYYFAVFEQSKKVGAFITRYPITGAGSIYPSKIYLRVTNEGLKRVELDHAWQPSDKVWFEMPNLHKPFFDSMCVHPSRESGTSKLNSDHDGDKVSCNIVYSNEAMLEVDSYLKSTENFISTTGELKYGFEGNLIGSMVLKNFSSGLKQ